MKAIKCLKKLKINSRQLPMISHIRYFSGSSFYLACGVGILEIVARFKNIISSKDLISPDLGIFKEFCNKNYDQDENFIFKMISQINNILKSTSDAFRLVYHHFEQNQNYLVKIESDFREILFKTLNSTDIDLKNLIISGENPITLMPSILGKMSKAFGLSITFFNLDSQSSTFNPPDLKSCPKFFLICNKGDYSLGYNEGMMKYDENQEITNQILEDLIENPKIDEKLNRMQQSIEFLIEFLTKKKIFDKSVANVIKSVEYDIKDSLVRDYLKLANNEVMALCMKCKNNHSYSEYIKSRCSLGCMVCINCLSENPNFCPSCRTAHTEVLKAELIRITAAKDLNY